MPFEFAETAIHGARVITPEVFEDDRGLFMETYVRDSFAEAGIDAEFVQDNYSESRAGVLRGLHYQTGEYAQAKTIQCTDGVVFDVVVDLRRESPTFGEALTTILSAENGRILFLPRGLAHGFLTLSESATTRYKVDNDYAPDREAGIAWDDPTLDVDWPTSDPILSEKDADWPTFAEAVERDLVF